MRGAERDLYEASMYSSDIPLDIKHHMEDQWKGQSTKNHSNGVRVNSELVIPHRWSGGACRAWRLSSIMKESLHLRFHTDYMIPKKLSEGGRGVLERCSMT